ncbi:MAG: hypothetical protein AMS22_02955 [Thiotrichales bacterium SG8_50]|nr:MAG: hypothetical protein AMS22_02955 [Thiotrichales bacterium SG8_50]
MRIRSCRRDYRLFKRGFDYYKEGDYSEATVSLDQAVQLTQEMKGGSLESLLPGPLAGWSAKDARSDMSGAAFGAGISAERTLTKEPGSVTIEIVADSPMLQGVVMMLTNPMFARADGGKSTKIGDQRGEIKYDPVTKSGDVQIVVANRSLVTTRGDQVANDDLVSDAQAIKRDKIAALL